MKKIFCLMLAFIIVFSFAACGENKNANAGTQSEANVVDEKTVAIVNSAFAETKKALESVTSLGYKSDMVLKVTSEGKTVSTRGGTEYKFIKGDTLKVAGSTVISNDTSTAELFLYTDGASIYGATAGTTYLITSTNDAKEYFNNLITIRDFYDASAVAPANTRIVDTSNSGYGFILDYPVDQLSDDFNKLFGTYIKQFNETLKATGLKVSGIIDDRGRIETETVTYSFTYDYTATATDVDPDNEGSAATTTTKTAECSISVQIDFDYGVVEVVPYDEIAIPSDSESSLKELSISDFQLLAAVKSDGGQKTE